MNFPDIKVPYLDDRTIEERAGQFLAKHHPEMSMPVPVEEIVEYKLGLDIIPLDGFQRNFGLEGQLSNDLREISVDLRIYEKIPRRYRFTLAHEVGHLILHKNVFEAMRYDSPDEWLALVSSFPAETYGTMEYQAYQFAGSLLVPLRILRENVERDGVGRHLLERFDVSLDVIKRRLTMLGIGTI